MLVFGRAGTRDGAFYRSRHAFFYLQRRLKLERNFRITIFKQKHFHMYYHRASETGLCRQARTRRAVRPVEGEMSFKNLVVPVCETSRKKSILLRLINYFLTILLVNRESRHQPRSHQTRTTVSSSVDFTSTCSLRNTKKRGQGIKKSTVGTTTPSHHF